MSNYEQFFRKREELFNILKEMSDLPHGNEKEKLKETLISEQKILLEDISNYLHNLKMG